MSKKHQYFIVTVFFLLITIVIKYDKINNILVTETVWKTFKKQKSDLIVKYPSTNKELKVINQKQAKVTPNKALNIKSKRSPSSVPRSMKKLFGLPLVGIKNVKDEDIIMINEKDDNWEESLGDELLRFHPSETKVLIRNEGSYIKLVGRKAQLVEKVLISYTLKFGGSNSFHAFVDSGSGKIIQTWNRTIHENYTKNKKLYLPNNTY
jgi:hypothetical protein